MLVVLVVSIVRKVAQSEWDCSLTKKKLATVSVGHFSLEKRRQKQSLLYGKAPTKNTYYDSNMFSRNIRQHYANLEASGPASTDTMRLGRPASSRDHWSAMKESTPWGEASWATDTNSHSFESPSNSLTKRSFPWVTICRLIMCCSLFHGVPWGRLWRSSGL